MIAVGFRRREPPLAPAAVVGEGAVAASLVRALLWLPEASLAGLRGVATDTLVVIEGEAARLPWVDGVVYLGRDPVAPSLLLPTWSEATVPADLLERALLARAGARLPLAILPPSAALGLASAGPRPARSVDPPELIDGAASPRLVSLAGSLSIDRATLLGWLRHHGAAATAAAKGAAASVSEALPKGARDLVGDAGG